MATSKVAVTEGTGVNLATHSLSEDAVTKHVSRVNINETDGSDVGLTAKLGIVTETAPATDTASAGLNGRLQRVAQRLTSVLAVLPAALGGTTASASLPVTMASDGTFATLAGGVTETAPATDTASSGLNGRLQRVAQRLTSLIALIPTSLGQGTMATSMKVVLPSDQSSLPVTPLSTTMSGKTSFATTISMISRATFTITLASLATAGGRQSTLISNSSNYPSALIFLQIKSGAAAPTVGTVFEIYLLRSDGTTADDAAGASDAAITIENAPLLGTMVVTASANKVFYGVFDTAPLGPLGATWGIAVKNSSGQTVSTTEGDHIKGYQYYNPTQS